MNPSICDKLTDACHVIADDRAADTQRLHDCDRVGLIVR
jgi:hypothetical protein